MNNNHTSPDQFITPQEFFQMALGPVSKTLDANGAPHVVLGFIPQAGVIHLLTNAQGKTCVDMLRALADSLNAEAARLAKQPASSIIIPPGVKAS